MADPLGLPPEERRVVVTLFERVAPPGSRVRGVAEVGVGAWSLIGVLLILWVLLRGVVRLAPVFPPLIVAGLVVLILEPLVAWLQRRGVPRRAAVIVAFLAAGIVLGVIVAVAIPALVRQFNDFLASSPTLAGQQGGLVARLTHSSSGLIRAMGSALDRGLRRYEASGPETLRYAVSVGLGLAKAGLVVLLGVLLGFFLLVSRRQIGLGMIALLPPARRDTVGPYLEETRRILVGYVRSRLIVSAVVGVLATIGLWVLGMKFWLLLGVVVAVTNLIPMVGSFLGAIPVALVALVMKPPAFLLVVGLMIILVHSVDGYILSPIVIRETVHVHPAVALLSVIAGAEVLGFWGILAAIPVAGLVQMGLRRWAERRRERAEPRSLAVAPDPPP